MDSREAGWSSPSAPFAIPQNYFEATFSAEANTLYHVWLRLRASSNSKANDSVWVQFSDALGTAGTPVWRIGSSSGLAVNLEACSGCGVSGWGWSDGAWWTGSYSVVKFASRGTRHDPHSNPGGRRARRSNCPERGQVLQRSPGRGHQRPHHRAQDFGDHFAHRQRSRALRRWRHAPQRQLGGRERCHGSLRPASREHELWVGPDRCAGCGARRFRRVDLSRGCGHSIQDLAAVTCVEQFTRERLGLGPVFRLGQQGRCTHISNRQYIRLARWSRRVQRLRRIWVGMAEPVVVGRGHGRGVLRGHRCQDGANSDA